MKEVWNMVKSLCLFCGLRKGIR